MAPRKQIFSAISDEVHANVSEGLHPTILGLVLGFLNYLKEPRYKNPLSLPELTAIFQDFYTDLNSLAVNIYALLNTNKRQLLQKSTVFNTDPERWDYLVAIANYLTSSLKLVKRTDENAMFQIRVFAFYKFLTVMNLIERAQYDLFASPASDGVLLYDKLFRFDERDLLTQQLFSEKLALLKRLDLPLSCFLETSDESFSGRLEEFFSELDPKENSTLRKILDCFRLLNEVRTPSTKLKYIAKIQKLLIVLLATLYDGDTSKVNNDILLPAFIYFVITKLPDELAHDLHLNFTFVKSFLNVIEPFLLDCAAFTLNSSISSYTPRDKRGTFRTKAASSNFFELLNLNERNDTAAENSESSELACDKNLIDYIQNRYLNNGEAQFFLTNLEAILYFLLSTKLADLVLEDFKCPKDLLDDPVLNNSIHELVILHAEKQQEAPEEQESNEDRDKAAQDELNSNRSRSNSLLNTITSAVSQVNRPRASYPTLKSGNDEEYFSFGQDFASSLPASPDELRNNFAISKVRNILGRLGSVSQFRPNTLEEILDQDLKEDLEPPDHIRNKRSLSLLERLSPNVTRARSGSESTHYASMRKTTLTKLSTGVSEFMNKLAVPVGPPPASVVSNHNSRLSLHSLDENSPFEDTSRRPQIVQRSNSTHTMERWLNNISEHGQSATENSHVAGMPTYQVTDEGSVFSASFGELTKYQNVDFESLTITDLKTLKSYYDQMCSEIFSTKSGSKTSNEFLPEEKELHLMGPP